MRYMKNVDGEPEENKPSRRSSCRLGESGLKCAKIKVKLSL
jgi:hypothetical protein